MPILITQENMDSTKKMVLSVLKLLAKRYPNDSDLGAKVRALVKKNQIHTKDQGYDIFFTTKNDK